MSKRTEVVSRQQVGQETLRKSKKARVFRDNMQLLLLMAPGIIVFVLFEILPMQSYIVPFKDYVPRLGIWGSEWAGLENFKIFMSGDQFIRLLRNTVGYGAYMIFSNCILGAVLAVLIYWVQNNKAANLYRTAWQFPRFLTMVIVGYMLYALLSESYGIVNQLIVKFGGEPIKWYSEPKYWPFLLCFVHSWRTMGLHCLLYYATLMGIDGELFDAAKLDGCNRWQLTKHIIVPSLASVLALNLVMSAGALVSFDFSMFEILPRGQGLLYPATEVITRYTYHLTLNGNITGAGVIGTLQSLIGVTLILASNLIVKKISPENSVL